MSLERSVLYITLTAKHFIAVQKIFESVPDTAICDELGISQNTLIKWRNDDDFKRALCEVASSRMGDLIPDCIEAFRQLIKSPKEEIKLQAAVKIWQFARMDDRADVQANVKIEVEYI